VQKRISRFGLTTKISCISGHHRNSTDDKQGRLKNCPITTSHSTTYQERRTYERTHSADSQVTTKANRTTQELRYSRTNYSEESRQKKRKNYESKNYAKKQDAQPKDQTKQQAGIYTAHRKRKYRPEDTPWLPQASALPFQKAHMLESH
jgi:hypothetical protein